MSKLIPLEDDKEKWKAFFLKSVDIINKNNSKIYEKNKCSKVSAIAPTEQIVKRAKKKLSIPRGDRKTIKVKNHNKTTPHRVTG